MGSILKADMCDECSAEDYISELLQSEEKDYRHWEGVCWECLDNGDDEE